MSKGYGSDDIYRKLVEEDKTSSWLLGLLAFAVVEEQRIEWANHLAQQNRCEPTEQEIQAWYQQQPDGVLLRAKGTAENALTNYADEVLKEVIVAERREVLESTIVNEIRQNRRFWPQFGTSVAASLSGALMFAIVLGSLVFVLQTDASPVKIGLSLLNK